MNQEAKLSQGGGNNKAKAVEDGGVVGTPDYAAVPDFDGMGLKEDLLRGIYGAGFERPSGIQQRAILPLLDFRDLIAQAQSGSGKTATFSIGLLQNIDLKNRECQALVLANTRELANQIASVASTLGSVLGVSVMASIGGRSARADYERLKRGVQFVVGTPGRVNDMLSRGALQADHIRYLVLDEADEMLSGDDKEGSFKDQVYDTLQKLPASCSVALFSATLGPECMGVAEKFMREPVQILVKQEQQTLDGIKQYYVFCQDEQWKLPTLFDLYESLDIAQAVIFVSTRRKVEWLSAEMDAKDFVVASIHADLTSEEREHVMDSFRKGEARVLVATDVLARGIDVQQVNLVINYDLPSKSAQYIHRIGRCGRFGRKGAAINLLSDRDVRAMRDIESYYCTQVLELPRNLKNLV